MAQGGGRGRTIVAHLGRDQPWAEWVGRQLWSAGVPAELEPCDHAGPPLGQAVTAALTRADRVLVLFSASTLETDELVGAEWAASPPEGLVGEIVVVRIEPVPLPSGWVALPGVSLVDLSADEARTRLLSALATGPAGATGPALATGPAGATGPDPLPGRVPPICHLPARDDVLIGRDQALGSLRERLIADRRVVIEGTHGQGGVGKSRLALEYAYRYAADYDLVWWLDADRVALLAGQLAVLAHRLGPVGPGAGPEQDAGGVAKVALARLRRAGGWLLIFDDAESADLLAPLLPGGPGHTLVTAGGGSGWGRLGTVLELDLLNRTESVALLRARHPGLPVGDASRVAAVLGDLPLALVLGASLLAETHVSTGQYLAELADRITTVLAEHRSVCYPHAVVGAVATTVARLAGADPAGYAVAMTCAFLGQRPIPADLLLGVDPTAPDEPTADGEDPLAGLAAIRSGVDLARAAGRLRRLGLVGQVQPGLEAGDGTLRMHPMVAVALRDRLAPARRDRVKAHVDALVAAAVPDETDAGSWPRWTTVLPYLLAADPANSDSQPLRAASVAAAWYLLGRDDFRGGRELAEHLHRRWSARLGPDDDDTLRAARCLAESHRCLGHYTSAQELDQDALARRRRLLGVDHRESLTVATDLAQDMYALGEIRRAKELDEDTLVRRRRVLGESHPSSLTSALRLARDLAALGEARRAAELRAWVGSRGEAESGFPLEQLEPERFSG